MRVAVVQMKVPRCQGCNKEEKGLELHERITDSGTKWICDECILDLPMKSNPRGHIKENINTKVGRGIIKGGKNE